MSSNLTKSLTIPAIFATMTAIQAPVQAQDSRPMGVIEVTAPRVTGEARPLGTGKTQVLSKKAVVDTEGLNLEKSSHMVVLEGRVHNVAREICEELEEEAPFGQPATDICTQRAVTDTMARVRETLSAD